MFKKNNQRKQIIRNISRYRSLLLRFLASTHPAKTRCLYTSTSTQWLYDAHPPRLKHLHIPVREAAHLCHGGADRRFLYPLCSKGDFPCGRDTIACRSWFSEYLTESA